MTSHPRFMTLQHSTHDNKAIISHLTPIISDSTSTVSLSSHTVYRSYNPHCMYNTATICMTSYKLHMTSHPLFMILYNTVTSRPFFMISHHVMISHPLCSCHQTQDTCHRMHCFWMITYSVLIVPLYQTKPQYLGCHIHFRHDVTPPVSDIASTVSLSSKPLQCYHTHF